MKQGFTVLVLTTVLTATVVQAQEAGLRNGARRTVAGSGGSSATLSDKHAIIAPGKSYQGAPYGEMFDSLAEESSKVGRRLHQIEHYKELMDEALDDPESSVSLYLKAITHKQIITSTASTAELDELSTKTKERLRKLRLKRKR